MKTETEIKEMIEKCQELRKYIPHHTMFGDDNWETLDIQIRILTVCVEQEWTGGAISNRVDTRYEMLGDDGWIDDPEMGVYDWLLGNKEDDLVSDDDISVFKKKAEEENA